MLVERMIALNRSPTAIASRLLPNNGLIANSIKCKRSINVAAVPTYGHCNRVLSVKYSSGLVVPVSTTFVSTDLTNLVRRQYVTKKTDSIQRTPSPTPPNLPQREQIEKNVFRVIAFFWDSGYFTFSWLQKVFKSHVIDDPTVQHYWKRFHEKMEESKRNV